MKTLCKIKYTNDPNNTIITNISYEKNNLNKLKIKKKYIYI